MSVLQKDLNMTVEAANGPLLLQWCEKVYGVQKLLCLICNISRHGHPMAEIIIERKKKIKSIINHLVSPSKSDFYFFNN